MLSLESPGWSYGTGGLLWPSAVGLTRYLSRTDACRGRACIELGTGTGAVGLFAAASGAASAILTDGKESVLKLARRNGQANKHLLTSSLAFKHYNWGDAPPVENEGPPRLVLGSDVTYFRAAHENLCQSLCDLLRDQRDYALLAHQHRSFLGVRPQLEAFMRHANGHHLHVTKVHTDTSHTAPVDILRITRITL